MITFIDPIGRTVIGVKVSETDTQVVVNNPVIIHVTPNPETGQIQVQSFPYIFVEFLDKGHRDKNNWTFNKASITMSDVQLDQAIINQYKNINSVTPAAQKPAEPEVIKLFGDE